LVKEPRKCDIRARTARSKLLLPIEDGSRDVYSSLAGGPLSKHNKLGTTVATWQSDGEEDLDYPTTRPHSYGRPRPWILSLIDLNLPKYDGRRYSRKGHQVRPSPILPNPVVVLDERRRRQAGDKILRSYNNARQCYVTSRSTLDASWGNGRFQADLYELLRPGVPFSSEGLITQKRATTVGLPVDSSAWKTRHSVTSVPFGVTLDVDSSSQSMPSGNSRRPRRFDGCLPGRDAPGGRFFSLPFHFESTTAPSRAFPSFFSVRSSAAQTPGMVCWQRLRRRWRTLRG